MDKSSTFSEVIKYIDNVYERNSNYIKNHISRNQTQKLNRYGIKKTVTGCWCSHNKYNYVIQISTRVNRNPNIITHYNCKLCILESDDHGLIDKEIFEYVYEYYSLGD